MAVFDLDGTLARGDTYLAYLVGYLRRRPARWPRTVPLAGAVALYGAGVVSNTWIKTTFLKAILGGTTETQLIPWTSAFVERLLATGLRDEGLKVLQERRGAGEVLVLASASPDLYVEPLARHLGFDHVICTRVGWSVDGQLTGELDGPNCYGRQKLARIEEWLASENLTGPLRVYTDHHSDLPLLQRADWPFAVCPSRRLHVEAKKRRIPIQHWK
ncbi:MAG: HAD family hydrolase [Alphaproteobacteria bacterium]|nr:HAD family hydrolase [Alphaproteobacteria bacterium]